MADKRISQLTDRGTVANSDVVPIVVSGASTTNKATISSIQTFMQGNLDLGVTSVGLSMPSAFTVTGSPVTSSGNISVVGAGTVAQYIRGDGSLADFPQGGGGGGASVSYYLNLSVSQGSIGGIAYSQMSRVPVFGAGTDVGIASNGYIASFITDAGNPALLEIPAGNWNFETYFQASSGGGSPTFYIELYKVNSGGTATLIASNSGTPESISLGTNINPYYSALAVPTTSLTLTDRLAIRIFVSNSGRTITLHTENSHLCQVITTFTTGLTALNGLTAQVQNFATGTSGTDFNISSASTTHTFNIPSASATNRGLLSSADWTTFNNKAPSVAGGYVPYTGAAANVDLGVYNLTASAVNVNGSGSNAGVINLESNAIFPLVNGYGTIGSGTTNQFNFYQTTGAGVFRGAILSLNSITASATRTFTLPDASGTLSLTTDLGAYLPLTGGTLTGALSGTSANFTGSVGIGTITPEGSGLTVASGGILVSLDPGANRKVLELYATSTGAKVSSSYVGSSSYGSLELLTSGLARLTIADTGGVTLTGALNGTSASFNGYITGAGSNPGGLGGSKFVLDWLSGQMRLFSYGANSSTNGGFVFNSQRSDGTNSINYLDIASTGAATFSSSVSINTTNAYGKFQTKVATDANLYLTNYTAGEVAVQFTNDANSLQCKAQFLASQFAFMGGGNVGIGTASPTNLLHLTGSSATPSLRLGSISAGFHWDIGRENASTGDFVFNCTTVSTGTTEKMRVTQDSAAFLRMASGTGGIQFNGDTAAANALDDYEEGTWTPTITASNSNPSVTYSIQTGFYTKIGRQVFIQGLIYLSSKSGGSGTARISGLPFSPANVDQNFSIGTLGQMQGFSSTYGNVDGQLIVVRANQNDSYLSFFESYISNGSDWPIGNLGSTFIARFTISYFTS
jgi:hypothetical protein